MADVREIERQLAGVLALSDFMPSILSGLQRLLGASAATVFWFERAYVVRSCGGSLRGQLDAYPPDLIAEDPSLQAAIGASPGTLLWSMDRKNSESFAKSRAYAEFYAPREIGSICAIRPTGLPVAATNMFGLFFSTPSPARGFDPSSVDKVKELEIPLRSAARRIARFHGLEQELELLQHVLDRYRGAFVLFNTDGRVIRISKEAERLLDRAARGDLARLEALARRQQRGSEIPARDAVLGRPLQLRSALGEPLLVEFSAIDHLPGGPCILAELESCGGADLLLASLTKAEVKVLRLLAKGSSNKEISEHLSVSTETVKTHIKHIFSKLGVESRAKAACLALRVLQGARPH